MTEESIDHLLSSILVTEPAPFDPPSVEDWRRLETKLGCRFSQDFKSFIACMSRYQFPGEILNVSSGRTNGNDSIALSYDLEVQGSDWDPDMIPFYAIGNGDYFCLNRSESPESQVYYYYADRGVFEPYSPTFEAWIEQLPAFLA